MITVNVPGPSATVQGPDVTFALDDNGGAHVSISLFIKGFPPIKHDETDQGALAKTIQMPPGTYPCRVLIVAYKYKALGTTYDTTISADGVLLASAKGQVPSADDIDFGSAKIDLVVT